jgi:hypothetical protein
MAKSFFDKIRKHRIVILIALIIAFLVLLIIGYTMNPDETWRPSVNERETESR